MVKSILKSQILWKKKEKRVHRLNPKGQTKKNRKQKAEKKPKSETQKSSEGTYINYYLEERAFFLLSEEKNSMQNLLSRKRWILWNNTNWNSKRG